MSQVCKECGVKIIGRSDKIFCSSHCRVSYNNMKYKNIKRLGHKNDIPSTSTLRSIKISIELPLCTHCSWKEDACSCITKIKDKTLGQFMSLLNG